MVTAQELRRVSNPLVARQQRRVQAIEQARVEEEQRKQQEEYNRQVAEQKQLQEQQQQKINEEVARQQRIQATLEKMKEYTGGAYATYNPAVGSLIESLARDTGMSVQEAKNYYSSMAESSSVYQQAAEHNAYMASQQPLTTTTVTEVQGMTINPLFAKKQTRQQMWEDSVQAAEYQHKVLSPDIKRYEKMGYSTQEATTLAKYSYGTGTTPNPAVAKDYLIETRTYTPKSNFDWIKYNIGTRAGETLMYFPSRVGKYIPSTTVRISNPIAIVHGITSDIAGKVSLNQRQNPRFINQTRTNIPSKINPPIIQSTGSGNITQTKDSLFKNVTNKLLHQKEFKFDFTGQHKAEVIYWTLAPEVASLTFISGATAKTLIGQQKLTTGETVGVGLIGLGTAAAESYSYYTKPKLIQTIKRNPKYTAYDVIQPISTKAGTLEKGKFILKTKIPSQEYIVTNKFRETFNMKPLQVIKTKPRVYFSETPGYIITREGTIVNKPGVLSFRKGANIGKISVLQGQQIRITPEVFKQLPKTTQYELNILAEAKAGVPISMEQTPNILGKNFEYSVGELESSTFFKFNTKRKIVEFIPYGKRTTIANIATIAKEVPQRGMVQVEGLQVFKTKTALKDVTKPFARASGKIPIIHGLTKILPGAESIEGTTGTILQLKVSPKSIQTLKSVEASFAKKIPRQSKPPIPEKLKGATITSQKLNSVVAVKSLLNTRTKEIQIQTPRINSVVITKQGTTETTTLKPIQGSSEVQLPKLETTTLQEQKLITIPRQEQLPKQEQQQISRQQPATSTTQMIKIPRVTKVPIIPKKSSTPKIKDILSKIGKGNKAYEVQIRRRGQFATIGKGLPLGKAKQLLARRVMGSLAQTGRLFEKGTTDIQDIKYELPSRVFTRLKKPTTEMEWVERRGQTLKRFTGEVSEIQIARRRKKTKFI